MTPPHPSDDPTETPLVDPPDLETVLRTVFGLRPSEREAYLGLLRVPDSSASEVAEELGRDRSNVNRSLRTLRERGLAERRRVLLEDGGHVYRYTATPLSEARDRMHATLTEWAEVAHDRIEEFGADAETASTTEAERAEGVYAARLED
jgi:predicted transcriptional regulator